MKCSYYTIRINRERVGPICLGMDVQSECTLSAYYILLRGSAWAAAGSGRKMFFSSLLYSCRRHEHVQNIG